MVSACLSKSTSRAATRTPCLGWPTAEPNTLPRPDHSVGGRPFVMRMPDRMQRQSNGWNEPLSNGTPICHSCEYLNSRISTQIREFESSCDKSVFFNVRLWAESSPLFSRISVNVNDRFREKQTIEPDQVRQ